MGPVFSNFNKFLITLLSRIYSNIIHIYALVFQVEMNTQVCLNQMTMFQVLLH